MSKHYKVKWTIDINAATPLEASQKTLEIHRDPHSIATFFQVTDVVEGVHYDVDLEDEDVDVIYPDHPQYNQMTVGDETPPKLQAIIDIQTSLWELAQTFNDGWEADWNDLEQDKYMLYYDHHPDECRWKCRKYNRGDSMSATFKHVAAKRAVITLNVEQRTGVETHER